MEAGTSQTKVDSTKPGSVRTTLSGGLACTPADKASHLAMYAEKILPQDNAHVTNMGIAVHL